MNRILDFYRLQESDSLYLFWVKEILVALLIFAGFWWLSKVVRWVLVHVAPRFTSVTATDLDDRILRRITPPISLLVVFAGLYYAISYLSLPQKVHLIASGLVFIFNIAILTNVAYRCTDEILEWYAARLVQRHGEGIDRQLFPLAEKLVTIFLVGTALIIVLKHFNYDILSLVTALGIGSLAIGMAAKDTLANMISGFTLMIDRPFRIGDRIHLKDGNWGDVADIGLRTTKIKTVDNTLLIIPNSDLCNTTVINQAFPDIRAKGKVSVGVAYGTDVELAKKTLVATALEIDIVLRDPAPEAYFTSFGDSALNMTLFFWVADYTKAFVATDLINELIIKRFGEADIVFPFPTRTIYLHKED
ncbi:large-conductance mechanosensitive channel MscMJLR [Geobacter sp. OR-1]|uniref:mechanosensitive ion channel family protein n=1 Tax=Geobacter sp. OR-1 TaxID=1266765 RepID=UPI0005420DD4|nr:mechanosensitive ion channel family protein [Geobacter sp. OR-1]GAM10000.1 large-conductance mechanosensitive channel MscMJLR [Geobacter sp. OR-1]